MEKVTIEGLSGNGFAAFVFMAADAKIANAVSSFIRAAKHNPNYQVAWPQDVLIEACIESGISISDDDLQLIKKRIDVLIEAQGMDFPHDWQVIY
jgi:hypothetical protein